MKSDSNWNLAIGLIIAAFVMQLAFSAYFLSEFRDLNDHLRETESTTSAKFGTIDQTLGSLGQDIGSANLKLSAANSQIGLLRNSLSSTQESLSETKTDLEKQIGSLKAQASSDFSSVIDSAVGSVVSIKTNAGQGTGFIITDDGYVVTNQHVLEGAKYANAITAEQETKPMTLIGYSNNLDMALLKISGFYDSLKLADSDDVKVGGKVIAIGNPYGLSFSVSEGIISAVHRTASGMSGEYIQTDAALNAGNSGGPLINVKGKAVGMNNFKMEGDNIGFALESKYILQEANAIALENLGSELL